MAALLTAFWLFLSMTCSIFGVWLGSGFCSEEMDSFFFFLRLTDLRRSPPFPSSPLSSGDTCEDPIKTIFENINTFPIYKNFEWVKPIEKIAIVL